MDEGTQMDVSDKHRANTPLSITDSFETPSNVTCESPVHWEKHDAPMTSTEEGMQIDASEAHSQKASHPIRES
jgi:hypothetical protein